MVYQLGKVEPRIGSRRTQQSLAIPRASTPQCSQRRKRDAKMRPIQNGMDPHASKWTPLLHPNPQPKAFPVVGRGLAGKLVFLSRPTKKEGTPKRQLICAMVERPPLYLRPNGMFMNTFIGSLDRHHTDMGMDQNQAATKPPGFRPFHLPGQAISCVPQGPPQEGPPQI